MDSNILVGKWENIKGRLKEAYGDLTDSDSAKISGTFQEAVGYLQEKYGETKDMVEDKLRNLVSNENEEYEEDQPQQHQN